jgi:HD-like signal output (HDOD) protein
LTAEASLAVATVSPADQNAELMRFSQQLAEAIAGPPIELPSYPVVALQAQRVLMDPNAGLERVISIIGSEPVLAAKVVSLANSAALSRSGQKVSDLRAAVSRLGLNALRTAAISFALAQLRNAAVYRSIAEPMKQLCQTGADIAAISCLLARQSGCATPDSAMLAGLVSGMGKLYILTRTSQYPALFTDPWMRQEMFQNWHAQVARSVLGNWGLAPEVVDAVAEIDRAALDNRVRPNLADVLSSAQMLAELQNSPDQLAVALERSHAARRLGLTADVCARLLADSAAERAQLHRALGN